MITPETITKKQAKKILKLLERETRCEIMARFGRFDNLQYADYAIKQIETKDRIRRLLFGTDNVIELGHRWGLLNNAKKRKQENAKKQKRKRRE